ncbi:flagellar M-ring protein FliF [bacterium]|nr:flagellar M-ring protein FliF [bacterium]
MDQFIEQIKNVLANLSMVRKVSMVLVMVLAVGVIIYLVKLSNQSSMEPLFTNLNSEDMGTILTELDKSGVKYQVDQEHRTVMVPATEVLDIRLKLASEGMPRFGGVGFELFDKMEFGASDFEQKIYYQRALEGELSRTIARIREVESARVHLVLPEKSLFADSQQSATASVILKMGSGEALSRDKVNSITHLVASAVESLDPEQVTVVDSAGHLLTEGGGDGIASSGEKLFDQKTSIERSYEKRIVELLSPVVGLGKVIARVSSEIDFTQSESTDEILDPNKSAVVSESRTTAKRTESSSSTGGVAGASGNAPGATTSGGGGSGNSDEGSEQIAYQVSKTIKKTISPIGAVKKLSVAILVDGTYKDGANGEKTFTPRAADELAKYEDLVKKAIGFSQDRGDQIKVETLAFQAPEMPTGDDAKWYEKKTTYGFLISVIGNVMILIVVALVFFFVIRPLIKNWNGGRAGALDANGTPLLEGEVNANLAQLVKSDPMAAANAIREWLK